MIGMLEGDLVRKDPRQILMLCGGVGYLVHVTSGTFENIGEPGQRVRLFTHLHVREDQLALYGFMTEEERDVFSRLLSVSGVGPRLALSVLSAIPHTGLAEAVERKDADALSTISGVGKKTAQRLIVELAGKLPALGIPGEADKPLRLVEEEAVRALVTLGYYPAQARKAVLRVIDEDGRTLDTEELIKRALSMVTETRSR